jgi:hypothetical protein
MAESATPASVKYDDRDHHTRGFCASLRLDDQAPDAAFRTNEFADDNADQRKRYCR